MKTIHIRNWEKHQHYKKRSPPWIKVYRGLLDDPKYRALDDFAARVLLECWLMASESLTGGEIPMDLYMIAWRTGRTSEDFGDLTAAIARLEAYDWITVTASEDASIDTSKRASIPKYRGTEKSQPWGKSKTTG